MSVCLQNRSCRCLLVYRKCMGEWGWMFTLS